MSQGFLAKCAIGKEGAWAAAGPTAVAVTEVLPITEESLNKAIAKLNSEYLDGSAEYQNVRNSSITADGDLTIEMQYDQIAGAIQGIDLLLLACMGGSATYNADHTRLAPTLQVTQSLTIAINKGVSVWELSGAKVKSWEISAEPGQSAKLKVSFIGYDLKRTGDAGIVNAAAAITALVPTNEPSAIQFDDLIARLNVHGAALVAADQICLNAFTLSVDNNLTDARFCTPVNGGSAVHTKEPKRNGKRKVELSITIDEYEVDTYFDRLNGNTPLQIDLKFSLGATQEFNVYLPRVYVLEGTAPVSGSELIQQTVKFQAYRNGTTNTNMAYTDATAITSEFAIETENARTAAP